MAEDMAHGKGIRDYRAPIIQQKHIVWRGGVAEAVTRHHECAGENKFQFIQHMLYFSQPTRVTERTWVAGELKLSGARNTRSFAFHPAGADVRSEYLFDPGFERTSYLVCFIEPSFMLRTIAAEHLSGVAFKGAMDNPGPIAWELAKAIEAECQAGTPNGTIYAEIMAAALSMYIMRQHSNVDVLLRLPKRGGLSAYALNQVQDYMRDRMHEDISLADAAAVCGLSLAHFARSFRASTGKPPHQWLIAQRVERAKDVLANTALSLSDIALACGFAEQSHFTRVFRQVVGTSPGAWRRHKGD